MRPLGIAWLVTAHMATLDVNTPVKLDGSVSTDEGDLQIEIMQVCKANAATLSTSHEATGADGVGRILCA